MQMRYLRRISLALVAAMTLFASPWVHADGADHDHADTSDAAKYRHVVMEAIGNHFSAIAMILTNRVDKSGSNDLQMHTAALAETSTLIGGLFGPGTEGGGALPIIWDEPEKLAAAAEEAAAANLALAEAAANSSDRATLMKAFRNAGNGCKGCHERYKEEDD